MKVRASRRTRVALAALAVAAVAVPTAAALDLVDWGVDRQDRLENRASSLFGRIGDPLEATAAQAATEGADSVALASGLAVSDVIRGNVNDADPTNHLYQNGDMIAFWPSDNNPDWAIVCIENGATVPGVQRVKLKNPNKGKVETILTGTVACDGIRRTPWNTILATEEVGSAPAGWGIEIYDPTVTTGVTIDRATGVVTDTVGANEAGNVVPRPALGRFAWEGIGITGDGTVYAGDELAPGGRQNGGAIFKFVPADPATASEYAMLSSVANAGLSPFAAGSLYALEVGTANGAGNAGQGNQYGLGKWVGPIDAANARTEGKAKGTGYYRPEDLHLDPIAAASGQTRFCWTNTGVSSLRNWGEVLCATETVNAAAPTGTTPEVQPFVLGTPQMNQPDNLEFQPGTGIVYVIEDSPNLDGTTGVAGDVWACLRDGADDDTLSDGCVRVVSVTTLGAEPTGFAFDASGTKAYLIVQHSPENAATPLLEGTYDELLVVSGFRPDRATAVR